MSIDKLEAMKKIAYQVIQEADSKRKELEDFSKKLKEQTKHINEERVRLSNDRQSLMDWRKRLKLIQLKINKIIHDRALDKKLKELTKYE